MSELIVVSLISNYIFLTVYILFCKSTSSLNIKEQITTNNIIKHIDFDYNKNLRNILSLCEKYPFLEMNKLGKSVVGRDIPILSLGKGKEEVLYAGAFHGNESITALVLLMFLEEVCNALCNANHTYYTDLAELLQKRKFHFIPIVNPDGCEISAKGERAAGIFEKSVKKLGNMNFSKWSANARGVDINHNFNAKWQELHEIERMHGIFGPRHSRFGGEFPESEPETKAIVHFCRKHNIIRAYAFHSQGEVIYWDFDKIEVKNAQKIASVLSDTSGYALDVPTGLAVGGGFKDWFILEFCRPAFTIEIGKGENPLPMSQANAIYKKIKKMLFTSLFI